MLISVFWYKDIAKDEQQWADFKLVLERCRLIQRAKEDFPSRGDDLGIQLYFLRLCEHCLRHLKWVADVRAMGWSLYNPGDRQRFMETLLWPPMKRMAIHRLVMIALKGAELRRCQLEWQANHDDPQARSTERKIERLMRQVDAYGSEAKRAMHRARGFAWGQVHYNLACLYALNIHDPREAVKGVPPSQQLRDDMAQKSVAHLYHALRDPTGPMASGSIWWVFEDPKLTLLREQRKSVFEEWRRVALAESICDR
jgi:hypothetical protein